MDCPVTCDCGERVGTIISSWKQFNELKDFFSARVGSGVFADIPVEQPYWVRRPVIHYAEKWYRCGGCGTLWELHYPDFPATGLVRKFEKDTDYYQLSDEEYERYRREGPLLP